MLLLGMGRPFLELTKMKKRRKAEDAGRKLTITEMTRLFIMILVSTRVNYF